MAPSIPVVSQVRSELMGVPATHALPLQRSREGVTSEVYVFGAPGFW